MLLHTAAPAMAKERDADIKNDDGSALKSGICGQDFENLKKLSYKPIGIIHSPFKEAKGAPIQPSAAGGAAGFIELEPEYCDGTSSNRSSP